MSGSHHRIQQSGEGPPAGSSKTVYMDDIKPRGYVEDGGMMDGLDHEQIIHEEILHEDMLGADEVEIEYVEGDDIVGAEEVVMEDDGHMVMEDDIATESLVALSQGPHGKNKGMRAEYIQHGMQMSAKNVRNPRILRRPMDRGAYVYEQPMPRQPVIQNKHNYPVPQNTKRLLPVATLPAPKGTQKDWREEQKRILEIYEIYDVLPDGMRESFKRILETKGDSVPPRNPRATYRIAGNQMVDNREYREQEMNMRQRQFKDDHLEQHHTVEEEERKKPLDPNEYSDMPQLEEAPDTGNQGQQPPEAQIDVEGYDSTDETHDQMQGDVEYIMEDDVVVEMYERGSPLKMGRRQEEVIMPEMREDYLGTMDANAYSANQLMINNQYTDSRYCPGCKLHLKRSIFYHHSRMIKKYGICNMFTPKRFPCGFQGCDERLGTVEKLCEHMFQIHGTPTDIKTEVFNSEAEFDIFLRELEAKGGNFRMSRGNKMIKAGLVQYFRCNRTQSLAKDKTMRICDEVSIFGEPVGSGVVERHDDPFSNPVTGGKPCLRTEEACTAFFRKAYMPNNTIEVRYCDHHLHEDERIRLPAAVKDRICEMHRKGLPSAVIMMVLQCEREKFALAGTCVERRVMQLTPKDISCVISTRNSNARKRKRPAGPGQQHQNGDDLVEDEAPGVRELQLTELEQKMLETFEANQEIILGDMQKMKRDENRKRNLRETVRVNIFNLGRFLKSANFTTMSSEQLAQVNEAVKIAVECTRTKDAPINVAMQHNHHNHHMEEHQEMNDEEVEAMMCGEELRETIKQDSDVPMNIIHHVPYAGNEETIDDDGREEIEVVNGGIIQNAEDLLQEVDDSDLQPLDSTGSLQEDRHSEEMEQIVVESDVAPPPAKKRRGRRPKSMMTEEAAVVKQEPQEDPGSSPSFSLPSKTRAGRVVRPSRYTMDI